MKSIRICSFCGERKSFHEFEVPLSYYVDSNSSYISKNVSHLVDIMGNQKNVLRQCLKCDFVFSKYSLDKDQNHFLYNEVINLDISFSKINSDLKKKSVNDLASRVLNYFDGRFIRVLDIGCGWGDYLSFFLKKGVSDVFAVEISPKKVKYLKEEGIAVYDSVLKLDKFKFDFIICNQFLEHDLDFRQTMAQIKEKLNSKGVAWITVPDASKQLRKISDRVALKEVPDKNINPWEHVNYFTPSHFHLLTSELNLQAVELVKSESKNIDINSCGSFFTHSDN